MGVKNHKFTLYLENKNIFELLINKTYNYFNCETLALKCIYNCAAIKMTQYLNLLCAITSDIYL